MYEESRLSSSLKGGRDMNCSNCENLVLVWGSHICPIKDMIISYPELAGRFCPSFLDKGGVNHVQEKQKTQNDETPRY